MTKAEAKRLEQEYSFLHLVASPSPLACIGWEILCLCKDGQSRRAYNPSDLAMLYRSGLIEVKR